MISSNQMVKMTLDNLDEGVMLVAKDSKHQERLHQALIKRGVKDIFVLTTGASIFLTDEAVENKQVPNYKVVIVPIKRAEGYSLTRLGVMIQSVYPSNQATRTQIEGRINRIGQKRSQVTIYKVHTGILTRILHSHNNAKSLALALESMSKDI